MVQAKDFKYIKTNQAMLTKSKVIFLAKEVIIRTAHSVILLLSIGSFFGEKSLTPKF